MWGLSPRVRGNPSLQLLDDSWSRSIPACAGEPLARPGPAFPSEVYPRVCGGTYFCSCDSQPVLGLSPRVRGNLSSPTSSRLCRRSIPACAGEPSLIGVTASIPTVYPRVCGGTVVSVGLALALGGLSPRVRGNRKTRRWVGVRSGSIPACAGEPPPHPVGAGRLGVYPRVCGGTAHSRKYWPRLRGLSPRVRGNLGDVGGAVGREGSIPACAGEPPAEREYRGGTVVYPRVCGGTSAAPSAPTHPPGLSPRVRGNLAWIEGDE